MAEQIIGLYIFMGFCTGMFHGLFAFDDAGIAFASIFWPLHWLRGVYRSAKEWWTWEM